MSVPEFLAWCHGQANAKAGPGSEHRAVCGFLADSCEPNDDPELVEAMLDELAGSVAACRRALGRSASAHTTEDPNHAG
jgi:hypothetical protein